MEHVPLIVLILVSIFFLVALIFSAKTWRWLNIVLMLFLFPVAITFIGMLANVMKENYDQRRDFLKVSTGYEQTVKQVKEVLYGPPDATEWTGVRGLTHRLDLAIIDRGRVWIDCIPGTLNEASMQIDVTTTAPVEEAVGDDDPPPTPPHSIEQGAVFYVFLQSIPTDVEGYQLPESYLGEFRVANVVDDETVTLQASLVLDIAEVKEAIASGQSWTLYEIMPTDAPRVFFEAEAEVVGTDTDCEELLDDETNFEERYNERIKLLTDKYLTPEKMNMLPTDENYIKLINSYALNWMTIENAQRLRPGFDPPIEEQIVKFKFNQKINGNENKVDVDVDPAVEGQVDESTNFDPTGLAKSDLLKHGGPVDINKDAEIYYDAKTARDGYEDSNGTFIPSYKDRELGTVEETRYSRPLKDFGRGFHEASQYLKSLDFEFVDQQRHTAQITETADNVKKENDHRNAVIDDLLLDKKSLELDQTTVNNALAAAEKKLKDAVDRLANLESGIEDALVKIAQTEAILVKRANDATRAAASAN